MTPHQAELTRQAVAIMTAWGDSGHDTSFGIDTLTDIIQERGRGDLWTGAVEVISGLVNLNGLLLVQRFKDTGQDGQATLQLVATDISPAG